ncbi:hypothetical protein DQ04_07101030 [Trypanosoma grayi]|uniref:hypothetical protein n=1 Tax=Trypanosoma grayi TaxID=71804 RepID=UPI0004F4602C|nr:hypothetical protein DQ04_07101030 [Trypanosoma grayi]KEG08476.1 hypothetical protein DQ04_07101030 [Trypanosoma grayi]
MQSGAAFGQSFGGRHHAPPRDSENNLVMNENDLMQTFLSRRRRMEAASRLTEEMMAQVRSIVDTGDNAAYMLLLEDLTTVNRSSSDARKVSDGAKFKDDFMVMGNLNTSSSPEVLLDQEMNTKLKRIRDMRVEQRKAAEERVKPAFQIRESEMELIDPPEKFTSTALAFSMQALATSVAKIIDATDTVLGHLAELDKTMTPPIFKEMNILTGHSQHAYQCYVTALQHLKQYETCEKALMEGTSQELSSMREQFLMWKEMLTSQEQKQKVAEEHLQALKHRLSGIDARCRMWTSVLLDAAVPPPLPFLLMGAANANASRISISQGRDSLLQPLSASLHRVTSGTRRMSIIGVTLPRRVSSARQQTPVLAESIISSSSSSSLPDELESRVDAMEIRVARFWSNPYVVKAQLCAERLRRRRHRQTVQCSPLPDAAVPPLLSRKESMQWIGSSLWHSGETHRLSRVDPLQKGAGGELGGGGSGKAVADVRLIALLRSLQRLASHPSTMNTALAAEETNNASSNANNNTETNTNNLHNSATSSNTNTNSLKCTEEESGAVAGPGDGASHCNGSASAGSSFAYGDAQSAADVVTGASLGLVDSIRKLLKYLDETHVTAP